MRRKYARILLRRPYEAQIDRLSHVVVVRISIATSEVPPATGIGKDSAGFDMYRIFGYLHENFCRARRRGKPTNLHILCLAKHHSGSVSAVTFQYCKPYLLLLTCTRVSTIVSITKTFVKSEIRNQIFQVHSIFST